MHEQRGTHAAASQLQRLLLPSQLTVHCFRHHPVLLASGSGPSNGGPWFGDILGGFCRFAPNLLSTICADSLDLGAGARVAQPSPAPQLRRNDLGGYPCRRGDLGRTRWNPCDVFRSRLIPEYGGSCAVRERAGQVAVNASIVLLTPIHWLVRIAIMRTDRRKKE
jgi:hypothetical protein